MAASTLENRDEWELKQMYVKHFDVKTYLSYYTELTTEIRFLFGCFHRIFTTEVTKGENVLDVGSGPSLIPLMMASKRFQNLVASDYLKSSLDEINKWRLGEPDAHDWGKFFQCAADFESEKDHRQIESRLRSRLKDVIPCDVFLSNPIAPVDRRFDVVLSSFGMETMASNFDSYKRAVANVAGLLNIDGVLVMVGTSNMCQFQLVEETPFRVVPVDRQQVEEACDEAGLHICDWITRPKPKDDPFPEEYTDVFVMWAKRKG